MTYVIPIVPGREREALREIRQSFVSGRNVRREELEGLHRAHPAWFEPLELLVELLLDEDDRPGVEACLAHAERTWPDSQESFLLRAMVLRDGHQPEQALTIAYEGLRRRIHDVRVTRSLFALVKTVGGRRAVREAPLPEGFGSKLGAKALALLAQVLAQHGDARRAHEIQALATRRDPLLVTDALPPVEDRIDWGADFVCVPSPGSDTAVVVFTGLMHETSVPVEDLHAQLEPFGFHFLALRDLSRLVFVGGHPALGADPAECARNLRDKVVALGASRIVLLGNSAGCVGALLYGALLGADAIVCYGPIASITASFENRGKAVARRIGLLAQPRWLAPPVEHLSACDPPIPVLVHYGERMALDRQHAETIGSLPRAELEPLPGHDRHDVLRELIALGTLRPRLAKFLSESVGIGAVA